jgi:hypothetical protein
MRFFRLTVGYISRIALVLPLVLGGSGLSRIGLQKQVMNTGRNETAESYTCQDHTITVDPTQPKGVDHAKAAILLCPGYKVTWNEPTSNYKFVVKFTDYPFPGTQKTFTNADPTTPVFPPGVADITVFKYTITISGAHGFHKVFDPHVIGGGGIPIEDKCK